MSRTIAFFVLCIVAVCCGTVSGADHPYAWSADDVYKTDALGFPVINACWNIPDTLYDVKNPLTGNPDTVEVSQIKTLVESIVSKNWNHKADISIAFKKDRLGELCDVHIVEEDNRRPPHTKGLGRQLKDVPRGVVLNFSLVDWPYGNARMIKNQYGNYDRIWHLARIVEIALHEFGHVLGLEDLNLGAQGIYNFLNPGSIMDHSNPGMGHEGVFPQINTGLEDIAALQALYGNHRSLTWKRFYRKLPPAPGSDIHFGITDIPFNPELCRPKRFRPSPEHLLVQSETATPPALYRANLYLTSRRRKA